MSAALVQRLNALFAEKLHVDVPCADTDLIESGVLDSLQFVELLMHIEQHMGCNIQLQEVELEDLRSVSRIAGLIASLSERQASTA
jgi:methoxymalonate biosynthesis acyl carrier protein